MKLIVALLFIVIICAAVKRVYSLEENQKVTYDDLLVKWKEYTNALNDDGVWVLWNTTSKGVPSNAVHAGYDRSGPNFVIRADHTSIDGKFIGKIIGKYYPLKKMSYIGYDGVQYAKTCFEILVQTNNVWADPSDSRIPITGTDNSLICRSMETELHSPGRLDKTSNNCYVTQGGKEVISKNYQILKKNC